MLPIKDYNESKCTDKEITSQLPDDARVLEIGRGTFTPVVFSTKGGIEASKIMRRIAERTERKTGQRYADVFVFHWLLDTRPHVEMEKNCPRLVSLKRPATELSKTPLAVT